MNFNLLTNIEICQQFKSQAPLALVYYSHIPAVVISLIVCFFVFLKNKQALINKLLLFISFAFSLWAIFDLIIWVFGYNSLVTMFSWSILNLLGVILFLLSLYFVYVFIDKKDISLSKKIIFLILSLPVILLTPTVFNLKEFGIDNCEPVGTGIISNYTSVVEMVVSLWIIIIAFLRYRKADENFKKQIILMTTGILLFLLSFSWLDIFGNLTLQWDISQYGLFGMPIFMGFLAYLIVKFKAFDIKMIGAQALVIGLIILVGSQFFFIQTDMNRILTGITLVLVGGIGIFLIRSVKEEVKRKEELQYMSDRLAQSNDKLRKLDNAKSEFISIASHQLRTPLTAIKGFISLLTEGTYGDIPKNQMDVLSKIYISNERLITLVEDLLNISRIESGRMEFRFEPCQLADLCKELLDTFSFRIKNAGLYVDFKTPGQPLPEVFVDSSKIREVLSNLIDNAIKYTTKGGITVRLERIFPGDSVLENINEKGAARVIVSDTGMGVPAEEMPYLFSKFSRGKDTNRLSVGGTGLGLYVGRSMVEANGGKIWVESEGAGKGSRFIIEVPVEQTAENLSRWN